MHNYHGLVTRSRYLGGSIALFEPFLRLFLDAGYDRAQLRDLIDTFQARLSKGDDDGGREKFREEVAAAALDAETAAYVAQVPETAWTDSQEGRAWGVVRIGAGHVIDFADLAEGQTHFTPQTLIGYALIHRRASFLRIQFSATAAGVVVARHGHKTNLQTELVLQLARMVRYLQAEDFGPSAWESRPLNHRFSTDDTRRDRLSLERSRARDVYTDLDVSLWLGDERQDTANEFFVMMDQFRGGRSESDGKQRVETFHGKRIVHISAGQQRGPVQEALLPPVLTHVADPAAIDGRARGGGTKGAGSLLVDWNLDVIPAVQAYVTARAQGASNEELALILRLHRVPTTPQAAPGGPSRSTGRRTAAFDELDWPVAVKRAERWLTMADGGRLQDEPDEGPNRELVRATNLWRLSKIELLRSGIWRVRHGVPRTLDRLTEFKGLPVHREKATDSGWVLSEQRLAWPDRRVLVEEQREVEVPDGVFKDAVEQPDGRYIVRRTVATTSTERLLDGAGKPVAWERVGIPLAELDALVDQLRGRAVNVGGRAKPKRPDRARALGSFDDWSATGPDDTEVVFRMWPRGFYKSGAVTRWLIWRRAEESWESIRAGLSRSDRTYLGVDYSDRHLATVSEGALLRSVAEAAVTRVPEELGDAHLDLGEVLDPDSADRAARRKELLDQLEAARDEQVRLARRVEGYRDEIADARGNGADPDELADQRQARDRARDDQQVAGRKLEALRTKLDTLEREADVAVQRYTDIDGVAAFLALLHNIGARAAEGGGNGLTSPSLASLITERFTAWRFKLGRGGVLWSCQLELPTTDGHTYRIPLQGRVSLTSGERNADGAEIARRLIVDGADWTAVAAELPYSTSLTALRKQRVYPVLDELGIHTYAKRAFLDHPHGVVRRAIWAEVHDEHAERIDYTPAFAAWARTAWADRSWSNSAVPGEITNVFRVAAMLAQHPKNGVDVTEIVRKTGLTRTAITHMTTPPAGGPGHIRRPAFFRWLTTGVIGLHPCPHRDCENPDGYASAVAYFPETHPGEELVDNPQRIGGVLCPDCLRLPLPSLAHVEFPACYLTPYTGTRGRQGTLTANGSLTRKVGKLTIAEVQPPSSVLLSDLQQEFGLPRRPLISLLAELGIPNQPGRRGGQRTFRTYPAHARKALKDAIANGALDTDAYRPDALGVAQAAAYADVTIPQLEAATDHGEVPVHRNRRGHRRWLPNDLDNWRNHERS